MAIDIIARGTSAAAQTLPPVSAVDNGKLLRVVDGKWGVKQDYSYFLFSIQSPNYTVTIEYQQSVPNGTNVDWGDGTVTKSATDGEVSVSHTYSLTGEYLMIISPVGGTTWTPGDGTTDGFTTGTLVWCELSSEFNAIGYRAFYGCTSLTSVTIPDSMAIIGGEAFYGCTSLVSVTIPSGATSIVGYAFSGCTSLASVTIPSSLTSFGSNAFSDCPLLTSAGPIGGDYSIEFGWATSIPQYAFSGCTSLVSVTIPSTVTSIGNYAFHRCTSLSSMTIPNSVTSIGRDAFSDCTSLASVTIQSGVTSIGNYAFMGCTSLASVTIPSTVTYIGSSAFRGCKSLVSVTIPSSVTSIADNTFMDCTSLASVTIPSSVTYIGRDAFSGCTGLTSVTIPSRVTSIGSYAFSNCTSLMTITSLNTTPPTIVSNAFSTVPSNCAIYVPAASVAAYQAAPNWSDRAAYIQAIPA